MFKISGLDQLSQQLTDAQKALESLNGEIGVVNFDPNDPSSIETAIQNVESMIDERLSPYENNLIIAPLAESMKEKYRESIIDRAAAARIEGEGK